MVRIISKSNSNLRNEISQFADLLEKEALKINDELAKMDQGHIVKDRHSGQWEQGFSEGFMAAYRMSADVLKTLLEESQIIPVPDICSWCNLRSCACAEISLNYREEVGLDLQQKS